VIETLALDLEEPEKRPDTTLPDEARLEQIKNFIDGWKEVTEFTGEAPPKKAAKRSKAEAETEEKPKKRAKKSKAEVSDEEPEEPMEIDLDEWKDLHAKGQIKKKTVPLLKEFIQSQNVTPKKKKAELVEQAEEILSNM
jgi:hypothetical protein